VSKTGYAGDDAKQAVRRQALLRAREQLGEAAYADFLTDLWAECGSQIECADLSALADIWVKRKRAAALLRLAEATDTNRARSTPQRMPHRNPWGKRHIVRPEAYHRVPWGKRRIVRPEPGTAP